MVCILTSGFIALSLATNLVTSAAVVNNVDARDDLYTKSYKFENHTITSVTRPVDEARLELYYNASRSSLAPLSPLVKRADINACPADYAVGCPTVLPDAPPLYDCQILANGLLDLANQVASAASPPCNNPQNCDCPNFSVKPRYEQHFMVDNCEISLVNAEPASGSDVIFDSFFHMGTLVLSLHHACISGPPHSTNAVAIPTNPSQQGRFLFTLIYRDF